MTHELKQALLRAVAIMTTLGFGYLFYAYHKKNRNSIKNVETNSMQATASAINDELVDGFNDVFAIDKIFSSEENNKKETDNGTNKSEEEKNKCVFNINELKKISESFEEDRSNKKITFYF